MILAEATLTCYVLRKDETPMFRSLSELKTDKILL